MGRPPTIVHRQRHRDDRYTIVGSPPAPDFWDVPSDPDIHDAFFDG